MRIARVLTRLNLGGPARQALASDPLLARRGHQVRLFAGTPEPGEGDLFARALELGLDAVRVPGLGRGWSVARDLEAGRFLRRALREFAPDLVHTHASKAGALGRTAARSLPAARVHTFHGHVLEGYFPEPLARGLLALERRLARGTDRVVAVSHATADDLLRLGVVEEERLVVVPPGVELGPFLAIGERRPGERPPGEHPGGRHGALRQLLGAGPEAFVVGVLGRLADVKRTEWALEVFGLLAARYPRLELVFLGDGDARGMLERRIGALPPDQRRRAHLVGAIDDVPAALADLDALLLTSRSEGLPVALIEAAAAGLPAVATRVGGVPEIVADERTGFLGETVDELAYGLARLLDDPGLGHAMGRRARLRVAARHSAEALAERLERLYAAVATERACAS
jgi:glycosyltransferase involved in cell wall biosynthesis